MKNEKFNPLKSILNRDKVGLLIIGAQKSGTTSLHNYLRQHRNIIGSNFKEIDFFSYDKNYDKGIKWYHKHFNKSFFLKNKYLLESSVEYMYIPNIWKRILKYNPEIKIIAVLRNPVERVYSAYHMYKKLNEGYGLEYYKNHIKDHSSYFKNQMLNVITSPNFLSLEEYVNTELEMFENSKDKFCYEPGFIKRGMYYNQLKPFFDNFNHENILIIDSEKLKLNKKETLFEILEWLKLDPVGDFNLDQDYLVGDYKVNDKNGLNKTLKSFYSEPNKKLFELIKKDFKWN